MIAADASEEDWDDALMRIIQSPTLTMLRSNMVCDAASRDPSENSPARNSPRGACRLSAAARGIRRAETEEIYEQRHYHSGN